ncbi:MAG: UDP-N-acetylmuramoyl-tripeptide--D-alanyl-D-alanine ligase [Deltaproteobacteria bacterium]
MQTLLLLFSILLGLTIYAFLTKRYLHIAQLEGYKNKQFVDWLGKNIYSAFAQPLLVFSSVTAVFVIGRALAIPKMYLSFTLIVVVLITVLPYISFYTTKKSKKPLAFTHRMMRLTGISIFIILIESFAVLIFLSGLNSDSVLLWFSAALILSPINTLLANAIAMPYEKYRQGTYVKSAKDKVALMNKLIKIGITGSYGKTSTKFILSAILAEKYKVLSTPESYNTTMGTTKVIRDMLNDTHEVFISEMGARNIGDIKELCDIVKPDYGIITSIGKQHLETFKSIDNIIKTKHELIEGLETGGIGFFPSDDDNCYELYTKTTSGKVLYGLDKHIDEADMSVKNIELSDKGSEFDILCKNGESIRCSTKLLGKHNVLNILGCAAIAKHLGLSLEQISAGIAKVEPVPHRLQILPTQNGTVVIDDAFNSNPVGAKMALEVLAQFKGRKIIITPGMVELGKEEYELNRAFGQCISESANIAILVGKKRTEAIQEGLKDKSFPMENIIIAASLDEASSKLAAIIKAGDVILFENDLPDNYDE